MDNMNRFKNRTATTEDLIASVINTLWTVFDVNPKSFGDYLNRSEYHRRWYEDRPPDSWVPNGIPKRYCSLRWWRPMRRLPFGTPLSEARWASSASLKEAKERTTLEGPIDPYPMPIMNTIALVPDIFRREWILSDPNSKETESSLVCRAEGVRLCSDTCRHCRFCTCACFTGALCTQRHHA